jgi:flagellar protein FlgJ
MDLSAIGTLYRDDGRLAAVSKAAKSGTSLSFAQTLSDAFSGTASQDQLAAEDGGNDVNYPNNPVLPSSAKSTGKARGKASVDRTSKLYEQCQTLETFVIKNILEGMRKTVQKSELSDTGFAGKMYEDMLYDEYAVSLSKNSGFGLADMAYLELSGQRGARA